MNKFFFLETDRMAKVLATGAILALFYSIYYTRQANLFSCPTIECLYLFAYGHLDMDQIKYVVPVILWMIPPTLLLYLVGDYVPQHLNRNGIYIFTRTDRRTVWLLSKALGLFGYVFCYVTIQALVVLAVAASNGFVLSQASWTLLGSSFTVLLLANYFVVLLVNLLSLRIDLLLSVSLTLGSYVLCLFGSNLLYEWHQAHTYLIRVLPFTQGIISWHSDAALLANQALPFHVGGFELAFSLVYLVLFITAVLFWGIHTFERMDLI